MKLPDEKNIFASIENIRLVANRVEKGQSEVSECLQNIKQQQFTAELQFKEEFVQVFINDSFISKNIRCVLNPYIIKCIAYLADFLI